MQVETLLESFDQDISKIKIDQVVVNKAINQLEIKKASLKNKISRVTRADNDIIPKLYSIIVGYAEELVFVFRLAYIQASRNTNWILHYL